MAYRTIQKKKKSIHWFLEAQLHALFSNEGKPHNFPLLQLSCSQCKHLPAIYCYTGRRSMREEPGTSWLLRRNQKTQLRVSRPLFSLQEWRNCEQRIGWYLITEREQLTAKDLNKGAETSQIWQMFAPYRKRHFALSGHPSLQSSAVRVWPVWIIQMLSWHSPALVTWLHPKGSLSLLCSGYMQTAERGPTPPYYCERTHTRPWRQLPPSPSASFSKSSPPRVPLTHAVIYIEGGDSDMSGFNAVTAAQSCHLWATRLE